MANSKVDVPVVEKEFKHGTTKEAPVELPAGGVAYATEIENLARDEDASFTVVNEVSEDGGKTWHLFGGFTRAPGPWVDRDGNPVTKCGVTMELRGRDDKQVSLEPGSLIRTTVIADKAIDAKLSHTVDVKEK